MKKVDGKWDLHVDRSGRILLPKDCSRRCDKTKQCQQISEDERKVIFERFRSMNWNQRIKIIVRSFGSSKNTKLEDGPYCTISGNEPSSVTLYKTGSESQTFCCNFKNLHLCSLNQRLKYPKGPIDQNTVKKMILNI